MMGKTQERMERGSRTRESAGSEKMARDGDKQEKMEGHFSTGQSRQRAVVPVKKGGGGGEEEVSAKLRK
jgi:hypothetical protein